MLAAGAATTPARVAALGFVFLFGLAGVIAEEQAVWQVRVPAGGAGPRLRAAPRHHLGVAAGQLRDRRAAGRSRVHARDVCRRRARRPGSGRVIGTGPGRGIALLLDVRRRSRKARSCWPERRDRKLRNDSTLST